MVLVGKGYNLGLRSRCGAEPWGTAASGCGGVGFPVTPPVEEEKRRGQQGRHSPNPGHFHLTP